MRFYETRYDEGKKATHISFDVAILQIECVLPDVYTDNGSVCEEGVLVGGCDDLKTLRHGIHALFGGK